MELAMGVKLPKTFSAYNSPILLWRCLLHVMAVLART
jgi:hypothetical protein